MEGDETMNRTFREHDVRHIEWLDGTWDFILDPKNEGVGLEWFRSFPADSVRTMVPSCWNNELGLYEYEGVAWYRTYFFLGSPQHAKLIFHGVLGHATVYMDGRKIVEHEGPFTPFEAMVEHCEAGRHEVVVRVDSTLTPTTLPTDIVDWFHYGGIFRSVELQKLPEVYIDGLKVDYRLNEELTEAQLDITLTLLNLSGEIRETPIIICLDDMELAREILPLVDRETARTFRCTIRDIRLWNVLRPELYMLEARTENDDCRERLGFRKISTSGQRILVNDMPITIKGVNRHEEHPEWGFAVPPKLMRKDLDIILDMGCNAVRGAHYPQSKYWMDLLDEHGIVYWSEIPIWGYFMSMETVTDPAYINRCLHMMEELIDRDYHHPSVLFWGVHNELDTKKSETVGITEQLVNLTRSKDSTRLVTYATTCPHEDILMKYFDVIGINHYFGWYHGSAEGFKDMLESFRTYAMEQGVGDKPVIMSEFGAAGIYGDTGWEPRLFSEDYQAEVLETALAIFEQDPHVCGSFVWQFADIRADLKSHRGYFRDRARSFNNKGLVNEYRKPKLAFRAVKRIYSGD